MLWGRAMQWGNGITESFADEVVTSTSAADVTPNGDPFASNTVSVICQFVGAAITVRWDNSLIKAGHTIQITNVDQTRVRDGFTFVASDGFAILRRSSGSIVDEQICATLGGVT